MTAVPTESMIHRRGTENVLRKSPIAAYSRMSIQDSSEALPQSETRAGAYYKAGVVARARIRPVALALEKSAGLRSSSQKCRRPCHASQLRDGELDDSETLNAT